MICPYCGNEVEDDSAGKQCPMCGNLLLISAGETDIPGVHSRIASELRPDFSDAPTIDGVRRSEGAASEAPTFVGKSPSPVTKNVPLHPEVDDSYIPFAGGTGLTGIASRNTAPPVGESPHETSADFQNDKTAILPDTNSPTRRATSPPSSVPIPILDGTARTFVTPSFGESDVQRRSSAPTAPRPDNDLAYQFLGPDGVNALNGKNIAGFVVKKKLGQGGMGAVVLARQISLDRDVALKILPGHFATDPDFVARFTREALSAAQLNHHNVIQVYDVGEDKGIHFIAMEFVRGDSLGAMTRRDGKLSIETATGFVLQAARGLKYAHERGVIHRDIKPDNLMVNEHGVVKIADMGLAKIKGEVERAIGLDTADAEELKDHAYSELTAMNVAMGTPAYMAPEQGRDASTVDHRADQYSLGCTLYYLIAGKAPFSGKTTFEVISKHMSEPVVPIDSLVKNVPRELSYIIEKMLSKNANQRYPSLREAIDALEAYLGISEQQGPYSPREHHVAILEKEQKAYYSAATLKMRRALVASFFALASLALIICAIIANYFGVAACIGLLLLTPIFNFLANGFITKEYLFRRVRAVVLGASVRTWIVSSGSILLAAIALYFMGLLMPWLLMTVVSGVLVAAYQIVVAKKLRTEREPALMSVQDMLKQLRVRGIDESAIQDFVCRFSGSQTRGHWEEFFEELFGYESMMEWRHLIATRDRAHPRKTFATWRDPLARWLDDVEQKRKKAREEANLARAEKERLKATGMDEASAGAEADRLAREAVDEGLLQKTVFIAAPTKKEIEKIDRELSAMRRGGSGLGNTGFRIARFAVAAVLLICTASVTAGMMGIAVPSMLQGFTKASYLRMIPGSSYNTYLYGLPMVFVVLILLATVFSRRIILPIMVLVGVLFSLFHAPLSHLIMPMQPLASAWSLYLLGIAVTVLGFSAMIFAKVTGGKF